MSTSEFVSKIDLGSLSDIITRFFDEIMILYNLVGSRRDMYISTDGNSSKATFIITMNSEEDAIDLYNNLNNTFFTIYHDKYIIEMQLSGRIISTVIYKAIP